MRISFKKIKFCFFNFVFMKSYIFVKNKILFLQKGDAKWFLLQVI